MTNAFWTLSIVLFLGLGATSQASDIDPCKKAAYDFAVRKQRLDYPGKTWRENQPEEPAAEYFSQQDRGFETWLVSYRINVECIEGYNLVVRRSRDGNACIAIKSEHFGRDCG